MFNNCLQIMILNVYMAFFLICMISSSGAGVPCENAGFGSIPVNESVNELCDSPKGYCLAILKYKLSEGKEDRENINQERWVNTILSLLISEILCMKNNTVQAFWLANTGCHIQLP